MKYKMFLTSGGLPPETREKFLTLLDKKPVETKVAFIPTAAYPEVNREYLQTSLNELNEMGITQIQEINLQEENADSLLSKLSQVDVIYVNGGNTFYLLYWMRKSGFGKIIKKLLFSGKIYVGVSAGSYVACPTIVQAMWKRQDRNLIGLKDFTALNLVPFIIFAHYEDKYLNALKKEEPQSAFPVIALNDKQAVLRSKGDYYLVGEGERLVFNNRKPLPFSLK